MNRGNSRHLVEPCPSGHMPRPLPLDIDDQSTRAIEVPIIPQLIAIGTVTSINAIQD